MAVVRQKFQKSKGRVAQSGERHAYTVEVTGSSPVPPTRISIMNLLEKGAYFFNI